MKTQSIDTSPDAERVLIGMLRSAPISKRFSMVQSWSCSMVEAGRFDVQQLYPKATMQEVWLLYAERRYGKGLVNELRTALQQRKEQFSGVLNFQAVLIPLVEVFRQLGVTYALTGSLVSSLYGMPRATMQLDLIAALEPLHGQLIGEQLALQYSFREDEVKTAIERKTSFVLMHIESFLKIVVSLPQPQVCVQGALERAHLLHLSDGLPSIPALSPEDMVILQLNQFKASGERADDIWYDLTGLLKVQRTGLDLSFLEKWAAICDVNSLLERAFTDAGLREE